MLFFDAQLNSDTRSAVNGPTFVALGPRAIERAAHAMARKLDAAEVAGKTDVTGAVLAVCDISDALKAGVGQARRAALTAAFAALAPHELYDAWIAVGSPFDTRDLMSSEPAYPRPIPLKFPGVEESISLLTGLAIVISPRPGAGKSAVARAIGLALGSAYLLRFDEAPTTYEKEADRKFEVIDCSDRRSFERTLNMTQADVVIDSLTSFLNAPGIARPGGVSVSLETTCKSLNACAIRADRVTVAVINPAETDQGIRSDAIITMARASASNVIVMRELGTSNEANASLERRDETRTRPFPIHIPTAFASLQVTNARFGR